MRDLRYWQTYRMAFLSFERLVQELTPFLQSVAVTFVRPPVPVRKQIKLVLYKLAHGISCSRMHNLYGCGESTIRKYTIIICRVLASREGIFHHFIHTPTGDRLQNIIENFRDITGLPNIAGAIDGTHIPLTCRSSRRYTPMPSDFFNRKKFHSIVLQGVCDADRIFWNVCAGQPGGVHDAGQVAVSSLHTHISTRRILAEPIIHLRNINIQPYLIGDTSYPSRPYMLKNYKPANPAMVDKMRFDSAVNGERVVIEQTFGSLKNQWRILKAFNMSVEKAAVVTLACCVLHNYCEIQHERVPVPADFRIQNDPYVGFHAGRMRLPREGEAAKLAGEEMRDVLFASWLERNPE